MTPTEILAIISLVEQLLAAAPTITAEMQTSWNNIRAMLSGKSAPVVPNSTLDAQQAALVAEMANLQALVKAQTQAASPVSSAAVGSPAKAPA